MLPELGEQLKLERRQWDILQDAFIGGDSYAYFYQNGEELDMEIIDNTCIMFADEQNPDIQEQPYLLVIQRRYVDDVKKRPRRTASKRRILREFSADDDTDLQINGEVGR